MEKKIVNEEELVRIGQRVLALDDDRVMKYRKGEYSQIDFLKSITPKDPFYITNGSLGIITNVDKQALTNSREKMHHELQIEQGDIDCVKLYENRKVLLEVYPELTALVTNVEKSIEGDKNSNKCGLTRRTNIILLQLLQLKYDGRSLKPLKNIVGSNGLKRLKGKKSSIKFKKSKLNKDTVYNRFCK